jgi:hypothetical protein
MYMRARDSMGPQVGRSTPAVAGSDSSEQFTDFSAIIWSTVFRHPVRL